MRSLWIAIAAGTLALIAGPSPSNASPPKPPTDEQSTHEGTPTLARALHLGKMLFVIEHDYESASVAFATALKADRSHPQAWAGLVACALQRQQWEEAIETATQWTHLAPREPTSWVLLGEAHRLTSAPKKAIKAYERALSIQPKQKTALLRMGDLLAARYLKTPSAALKKKLLARYRQFLRAAKAPWSDDVQRVEAVVSTVQDGPTGAAFLKGRDHWVAAHHRWQEAPALLGQAHHLLAGVLSQRPTHGAAHYFQGLVHGNPQAGEHFSVPAALEQFKAAGSHTPALVALARHWRQQGEPTKSLPFLKRALKRAPRTAEVWCELAVSQIMSGRQKGATRSLERCIDLDPSSHRAHRARQELRGLNPRNRRVDPQDWAHPVALTNVDHDAKEALERRLGGVHEESPHRDTLNRILQRLVNVSERQTPLLQNIQVIVTRSQVATAFPLGSGAIYVTRGTLEFLKRHQRAMNVDNGLLAAVLAPQLATLLAAGGPQTGAHRLTSELDARTFHSDRMGARLMLLAGYDPYDTVVLLRSRLAQFGERIPGLGLPSFNARIHALADYWFQELASPFAALQRGTALIAEAKAFESRDLNAAAQRYRNAIDHIRQFTVAFTRTQPALSSLGAAYAQLGLLEVSKSPNDCRLCPWYTATWKPPELLETFVSLRPFAKFRRAKPGEPRLPVALRTAKTYLTQALQADANDQSARRTLAVVLEAMGNWPEATKAVNTLQKDCADNANCGVAMHQIFNLQGIGLAETGRWNESVHAFERCVQHAEEAKLTLPYRYNLARALERAGRTQEARDAYRQVMKEFKGESPWRARSKAALLSLEDAT